MSDFWKFYLALVATITALLAASAELWRAPIEPANSAYPAPITEAAPTWIDACGVFHYGAMPYPYPTAVPLEDLEQVCHWGTP